MIAEIAKLLVGVCVLVYAVRWFFKIDLMIKEVKVITAESKATASMLEDALAEVRTLKREAEERRQQ